MKKLLSIFAVLLTVFTTQCLLVSCEKDNGLDYAGESEADYREAEYNITSTWDFSNVKDLSASEKQTLKSEFEKACSHTQVFESRVAAVKKFDEFVEYVRTLDIQVTGVKAKLYLKRDGSIIKSATLTW